MRSSTTKGALTGARTFVAVAWLFVACLVVQFFLVGVDIFEASDGELHRDFAYTYGWLAPGLVLLGGLARLPRRPMVLAVTLLVLYAVQTYLPLLAGQLPWIAAFHSINALLVVWVAVLVARSVPAGGGTADR